MRSVSSAICTSGEPVSDSCWRNWVTSSAFLSVVTAMISAFLVVGAAPARRPFQTRSKKSAEYERATPTRQGRPFGRPPRMPARGAPHFFRVPPCIGGPSRGTLVPRVRRSRGLRGTRADTEVARGIYGNGGSGEGCGGRERVGGDARRRDRRGDRGGARAATPTRRDDARRRALLP